MENRFLSLLYPSEACMRRHKDKKDVPYVSPAVCEELGLTSLLSLKNSALSDYFSSDPETLAYRQATFAELDAHPELVEVLGEVLPILSDIEELRKERPDEHERLMAILEDEALCADVSPTLLSSYMKRRLGYGDAECGATGQREVVWRFEHDIYKDGE